MPAGGAHKGLHEWAGRRGTECVEQSVAQYDCLAQRHGGITSITAGQAYRGEDEGPGAHGGSLVQQRAEKVTHLSHDVPVLRLQEARKLA